jgi:hypothetical protein
MLAPTTLLLLGWSAYEISRFAGAFFPLAR